MTTPNEQPVNPIKVSEFLTLDDLAKMFGINQAQLRRWRNRGLPVIVLGKGRWIVHEHSLGAWLKSRETSRPDAGGVEDE